MDFLCIKFDENGETVGLSTDVNRVNREGFEFIPEELIVNAQYLKKVDGEIVVDKEALTAKKAREEKERIATDIAAEIDDILVRLHELDCDINACEDGQKKSKTVKEYRADRAELRNTLRLLKGKSTLEMFNGEDIT